MTESVWRKCIESVWRKYIESYVTKDNVNDNLIETNKPTLLHIAAKKGFTSVISWLVEDLGADINVSDEWNETPLCDAVRHLNVNAVSQLLSYGACVDINVGTSNWSPLDCLLHRSEKQLTTQEKIILAMLLDHGAKLHWVKKEMNREWANTIVVGRGLCIKVCLTLLGIRRFHCSVLNSNVKEITQLIAKKIWETRHTEKVWIKEN